MARLYLRLAALTLASLAIPASASADVVLELGANGRVRAQNEPIPAWASLTAPPSKARRAAARSPIASASRRRTVQGELRRMLKARAISRDEHDERRKAFDSAKKLIRKLSGTRKRQMAGLIANMERIAAQGSLTVSRLEPLWTILARNRQWWTTGPLIGSGTRVSFAGSEVVYQYFPGYGLQFHPLANFGKLNGLWQGKRYDDRLELLLDELLAFTADRAGGVAWEYYFPFGGGRPPWVSGLAQGTALQAIARAAIRLKRKEEILPLALQGLKIFERKPPVGVRVRTGSKSAHYVIYSFNSRLRVLNGFVQALNGLYDFGAYANDQHAKDLFADGERQARREVPSYDTGFWSLYSRLAVTRESDLGYHKLLRGFLMGMCERTATPVYCTTESNFGDYLVEAPTMRILTRRLRGGKYGVLRFRLSKISRVTVRVARGSKLMLQRGGLYSHGGRSVGWSVPRKRGKYTVRITATDLAGNSASVRKQIEVLEPAKRRRSR